MQTVTINRLSPPEPRFLARARAVPTRIAERLGLGAVAAACMAVFVVFPTYPNYDSYYSLLWGRELVHLQHLSFEAYRAPTEHPLAIVFGALLAPFGHAADRVMIACTLLSFVLLVWGVYRLARVSFNRVIGAMAAGLLVSRLDFGSLAIRGYIDIPYLAIVVWAAVLEAERPRRGLPVFLLLAMASLMRPEAWVLVALYFLWMAWHASWAERARYALLTAAGPVLWAAVDAAVTGDPLFSLHSTSGLATSLGRNKSLADVPDLLPHYLVQSIKAPVALAAVVGLLAALVLVPRRTVVPGILLASGIGTFALVGAAGLSVIARYLAVSQLMLIVFAAVLLGGFSMLEPGWWRRVWALAAVAVVIYGVVFTVTNVKPQSYLNDFAYRGTQHPALSALLERPVVRHALRCGRVSVPNHKLIPETRWVLDLPARSVIARSDPAQGWVGPARANAPAQHGLALFVLNRNGIMRLITQAKDDPSTQTPRPGFRFLAANTFYGTYVRCGG